MDHIEVDVRGPRATARLQGDFDMAATFTVEPELERVLEAPGLETLTLDLSGLSFIDSTGVGVLLRVHDEARGRGLDYELVPGPPEVQRVFAVAGLDEVLPFRPPEAAA